MCEAGIYPSGPARKGRRGDEGVYTLWRQGLLRSEHTAECNCILQYKLSGWVLYGRSRECGYVGLDHVAQTTRSLHDCMAQDLDASARMYAEA